MKPLFVTGIGTDVGKTIISALLVEKLQCDYWKPIQSGDLENSDTIKLQRLVTNSKSVFHPEAYRLNQPFSPHKAAELDGIEIELKNIVKPHTSNRLLIEGAGGLMVPLNRKEFIIDLIEKFDAELILVVKNYLGSINHTLLSLEVLKQRNIPIKGLIFNGEVDEHSESLITGYSNLEVIGRVPLFAEINKEEIREGGKYIRF